MLRRVVAELITVYALNEQCLNVNEFTKYQSEGELVYPGGGIIVGSSGKPDTRVVTLP